MHDGQKVQTKTSNEAGVIENMVGNIALVRYGDRKEKINIEELVPIQQSITREEYIQVHQEMLSDEVIQSYFHEKLSSEDMDYHRTILLAFGVEMSRKLFIE